MQYHIAPLRLTEYARWAQLRSDYQMFYGIELPVTVTENAWQRIHNGRARGLGARDSTDALLGIVHFLFREDTWSIAPACYLRDLYIEGFCDLPGRTDERRKWIVVESEQPNLARELGRGWYCGQVMPHI